MKKNVLAVDFGGSNGRVILGRFEDGKLTMEEIHRFPNHPLTINGSLHWDFDALCQEMLLGIRKAVAEYEIDSIGIDTWGVDYGLIDKKGRLAGTPYNYRDERTSGYVEKAFKKIPEEKLYQLTGNQIMEINTLFQLMSEQVENPQLNEMKHLLFMPDLFNWFLTGVAKNEATIASTSQLVDPRSGNWSKEIIELFEFPQQIFGEIIEPGALIGQIKPEHGLPPIPVLAVCSHDTASAVASVPSQHDFLYVSCGTWSLVGTELPEPILNDKAQTYNLTNERGINGTTRFLKNITGLWILQEVKRDFEKLGKNYTYPEMEVLARQAKEMKCFIDTDDDTFTLPGGMIARIQAYAEETNQDIPQNDGEIIRCIYESLAFKYKYTFMEVVDTVGREFDSVNIVGGGSKSKILCEMVAEASGLTVFAGPDEATAIGNINVQLMAQGALPSLASARFDLRFSEYVKEYKPRKNRSWDQEFGRYVKILKRRR